MRMVELGTILAFGLWSANSLYAARLPEQLLCGFSGFSGFVSGHSTLRI